MIRTALAAVLVGALVTLAECPGWGEPEVEPDGDEPMPCVALPQPMGWPSAGEVIDRRDVRSENPLCAEGQFVGVKQDDGQTIYTGVTATQWERCQIGARWESTVIAGSCT